MKKILFFLALTVFCFACTSDAPQKKVETPSTPKIETKTKPQVKVTGTTAEGIDKGKVIELINSYRTKGCNCGTEAYPAVHPVTWNDALNASAQIHAEDMAAKKFQAHKGSDGSDLGQRIKKQGYDWAICGENIARNFDTEEKVIEAWMKSPNHCRNIMDVKFHEVGLGGKDSYWTLDVATAK